MTFDPDRGEPLAQQLRAAMHPLVEFRDKHLDIDGDITVAEHGQRLYEAAEALDQAFDAIDSSLRSLELEDAYGDEEDRVE